MQRRDQIDKRLERLRGLEDAAQARLDKLLAAQPGQRPFSVLPRPGRRSGPSLQ